MKIEFVDEMLQILGDLGIDRSEVCLVTSAVFTMKGFRQNQDLEFTLKPGARKKLEEAYQDKDYNRYSGYIHLTKKIACVSQMYQVFGLTDEELFEDSYSTEYEGYRVIALELYLARKRMQNRKKDENDLKMVRVSQCHSNQLWKQVDGYLQIATELGYMIPQKTQEENFTDITQKKLYIFGMGKIAQNVYQRFCRKGMSEHILGFIASCKESDEFCDKKVYTASEIDDKATMVLLCIELHSQLEVQQQLTEAGFTNLVAGYQFWE